MSTGERRREPRWPCRVDVAIMRLSSEDGFVEAEVSDFSDHGLGLLAPQPLRDGEQIVVKAMASAAATSAALMLIYTVRRCEPEGRGYRVGSQFTGAITSPENQDEQTLRAAFVAHLHAAAERG